jgi:acetylornithine/N-succinyldiaminopimelate aminotransferase
MHVSNYFFNEQNIRLADELCAKTGFDRAFFCNSGAEANEALLKLARRHHYARGDVTRTRLIAFHHAFHGRSMGAVSLTGTPEISRGVRPDGPRHHPLTYGDLDAVRAAMGPDVAGVFVEPVQARAAWCPRPQGSWPGCASSATSTARCSWSTRYRPGSVAPARCSAPITTAFAGDAIALAKGLGGGFPIGAMLVRESLANALPPGTHGSTFGATLSHRALRAPCLAVIEEERLIESAARVGDHLGRGLAGWPHDTRTSALASAAAGSCAGSGSPPGSTRAGSWVPFAIGGCCSPSPAPTSCASRRRSRCARPRWTRRWRPSRPPSLRSRARRAEATTVIGTNPDRHQPAPPVIKRDLLTLSDLGTDGVLALLRHAEELERTRHTPVPAGCRWPSATLAMIFDKPSTRTRIAFEVAAVELGAHPILITPSTSQTVAASPMEDTARVFGRTVAAVACRTDRADRLETLARACRAPVLNALTDDAHPLQTLADLHTVRGRAGRARWPPVRVGR